MKGSLVKVTSLSLEDRNQCFDVLQESFEGVSMGGFLQDLFEKEQVILLRDGDSQIVGFSTLMSFPLTTQDGVMEIVFSGDTAVHPCARNSREIGRCLAMYLQIVLSRSENPVWYVLISKGWRTFRAMWFLFQKAYPHNKEDLLSPEYQAIVSAFGRYKYQNRTLRDNSVLIATDDAQRIRLESEDLIIRNNEDGRLFTELNPGYVNGDELVCIAPVRTDNMTRMFFRCQPS